MSLEPKPAGAGRAFKQAVGKPSRHDSAINHVTGAARYIDDLPEPEGTLHIAPGYCAAAARGKITHMNLDAVRSAPGVVAVMTAGDIPGTNDCSPSLGDDPVLAENEVLFWGQVVFAVVAKTREQARRAAKLATIEVDQITPIVTVDQALDADTVVLDDYAFIAGDPQQGLRSAEQRFTGQLRIGGQEHFYLEGQVSFAEQREDGDIFIHCSTQHPSEVQHTISKLLGQPHSAITVETRRMGGGFGGKESQANQWAALAALGAHVTSRPCKVRLDRDDDMIMTGKRHDFLVDYDVGYSADGRLSGTAMSFASRCGYSADLSLGVNDRTMFHADNAYYLENAHIHSRRMKTDTVSNTAFRGFGGPQGVVAIERIMDAIAIANRLDPLDVRRTNFYGVGERDMTPYGMRITDNIIDEIVDQLEVSSDYRARRADIAQFNATSGILKKGIALTPVKFGISFTLIHLNQAGALVNVYSDGSVQLNHGGTEMGQGLFVKIAQVVAEVFGIDLDSVKITATNTDKVPNTAPTAASSGSDLNGMAAKIAAQTIKRRMIDYAVSEFDVMPEQIEFRDNQVVIGNTSLSFGELAKRVHLARISLSSTGFYSTPDISWDRENVSGRPFLYFSYGAACSEVTVDTTTGEMRVDRVDIVHDVGKSLNPAIDIGQIEGGFVQGMGWLTTEELVYDDQGRLRTHAPSTYKIPTASDVPEEFNVTLHASKGNQEKTIYRSKAIGEPPVMLAASVFSAITHAIASMRPGIVPPLDAPATPEAILRAVRAMKGN